MLIARRFIKMKGRVLEIINAFKLLKINQVICSIVTKIFIYSDLVVTCHLEIVGVLVFLSLLKK